MVGSDANCALSSDSSNPAQLTEEARTRRDGQARIEAPGAVLLDWQVVRLSSL